MRYRPIRELFFKEESFLVGDRRSKMGVSKPPTIRSTQRFNGLIRGLRTETFSGAPDIGMRSGSMTTMLGEKERKKKKFETRIANRCRVLPMQGLGFESRTLARYSFHR